MSLRVDDLRVYYRTLNGDVGRSTASASRSATARSSGWPASPAAASRRSGRASSAWTAGCGTSAGTVELDGTELPIADDAA